MIRKVEFHHGVALARLIRGQSLVSISIRSHQESRSGYVLNDCVGLFIKYSTSRLSPWSFTFTDEHQEEVARLDSECDTTFVALVCGGDGIACLGADEYQILLDDKFESAEWIKVARSARQKYVLTGSDAERFFRVGDNEYPAKIFEQLGIC